MRNLSSYNLPGLRFIGWIDADKLKPCVCLDGIVGKPVPILTDIHEIDFCGDAECQCKTSKEGSSFQDSASLKFFSAYDIPISRIKNVGFVVTDLSGNSYLIGSKEPPYAEVEISVQKGSPNGEQAGFLYTIKQTACKSLIPCVVC